MEKKKEEVGTNEEQNELVATLVYATYKSMIGKSLEFDGLEFEKLPDDKKAGVEYRQLQADAKALRKLKDLGLKQLKENQAGGFGVEDGWSIANDRSDTLNTYQKRLGIGRVVNTLVTNYLQDGGFEALGKDGAVNGLTLILSESWSQSGKTKVGNEMEEKVESHMLKLGWVRTSKNRKDSITSTVEYDRTFEGSNGVKAGLSCKRTQRERSRMNMAPIESLDVDIVLHASLGSDLSLNQIKDNPSHIFIVPDDFVLTGEQKKSEQVKPMSWVTPKNVRSYIDSLGKEPSGEADGLDEEKLPGLSDF